MTRRLAPVLPTLALAALAAAGCGRDNSRAEVSGNVTLDGQPVEEGRITFYPAQGTQGPVAGAGIANGRYTIPARDGVAVGTNRVEIHANRKTGKQVKTAYGGTADETAEAVPAKYHGEKSELVRTIEPGRHTLDFDLQSK